LTANLPGGENRCSGSFRERRRAAMVLSTAKIEDFDRFWQAFST
jgi:hypothetical protein